MTTYNSYEAAKIANPESEIVTLSKKGSEFNGKFEAKTIHHIGWDTCNPADHCMTVERFLADGHKFAVMDVFMSKDSVVVFITSKMMVDAMNAKSRLDCDSYILRAAALEEKPSEKVEWVNGEGLPPVGALCKVNRDPFVYRVMYSSAFVVIVQNLDNDNTTAHGMDIILDLYKGDYTFSKPETQQQREDRERLEAAYDLYVTHEGYIDNPVCSISIFSESNEPKNKWLAIVDKTNYRKGVK